MEPTRFARAGANGRLTLAVPSKGRMAEPALCLCADAGLRFEATERALLVPCANAPVDLLLVRAHDVPEYVQDGVVDLGITGANLVAEAEAEVETVAELGFARCSLQAAVPQDAAPQSLEDLDGLRVATTYPVSTRAALERLGVGAELVPVSGSVEAAPRLGLADAIADLVSTGSTASANGLRLLGPLLPSQAVLVAARRRRYLMLNAPRSALDRIAELLPGMGAPSVIDLAEPGHVAVHAAVEADDVWNLLAPLKAAGASSILVLPAALLDWSERLDGVRPGLRVPAERLRGACLGEAELAAIRALAGAVEAFCAPQRPPDVIVEAVPGIIAERRWLPLGSVGIYVPGGRAILPSSLVMAAVPARLAGVERIVVVTPRPHEATLATARELGLDEVYAVGGAQAVAALAYGTETIRPVDKIVGPGSRWVTAAKLLVSSRVGIDLPAGPSEVVLIADASADPVRCAADLLAQAEHGPDSAATLLSLDAQLAATVAEATADAENVAISVVTSLDEALVRSEAYAPEHLELWVERPDELLPRIRNAGTVFVRTSAVVGDYAAGASHILPTGGLARGTGGGGPETLLKPGQGVRPSAARPGRAPESG